MTWMRFLLLIAAVGGCAGPGGDGDVVSCSCEISYIDQDNQAVYPEGTMPISLCETSFATDHSADAEMECVTLTNTAGYERATPPVRVLVCSPGAALRHPVALARGPLG